MDPNSWQIGITATAALYAAMLDCLCSHTHCYVPFLN